MTLIYDAGLQARRVKWVLAGSAVVACAALWAGIALYNSFGLNPADGYGGQLAPVLHRLGLATLIGALGLLLLIGMLYYSSIYVVRISYLARNQLYQVNFSSAALRAPITFSASEIRSSRYHEGMMGGDGVSVNAPWTIVRVSGERRPLLIDDQGEILSARPMAALCRTNPGSG